MYDSITGEIARKDPSAVVLRAGGIGYVLNVPRRTLEALPEEGKTATLYCHLSLRDDSLKLYGFESAFEREIFRKLNSVSGVGAATALLILSEFTPLKVIETIMSGEDVLFRKVKGVGTRTAQKIVIELKGKVEEMGIAAGATASGEPRGKGPSALGDDLLSALASLGFPRPRAREAALRVLSENPGEENIERLIKESLAVLSGR